MIVRSRVAFVGLLWLVSSGCIGFTRVAANADRWQEGVRAVGVLSAIGIYEVHPGGIEERHDEWTEAGAKTVIKVLQEGLKRRGVPTRVLSWKGDDQLEEVRLLYGEVATAILKYTYYPYPFPTKRGALDYQVGPIGPILDRAGVDALVIAAGRDNVGANGRPVSAFGGKSEAVLSVGLIDRSGAITWFDLYAERGLDLRNEADVRRMIERILSNMPGGKA